MRNYFDEQLLRLNDLLTEMGALCEEVIAGGSEALSDKDTALADRVMTTDGEGLMRDMARSVIFMVTESVEAFVKKDTALAEEAIRRDDVVDEYFDRVKKRLIERIAKDPQDGEYALDLLMIAKYFERIGDHAVNIAEWVNFSVTGEHVKS